MALLWLLLRVRWRRALVPSLALALLIGVVGGFVLASAAAARRVENSYQTFIADIDAPDLAVIPNEDCGQVDGNECTRSAEQTSADAVLAELNAMEVVERARLAESVIPYIIDAEGTAIFGTIDNELGCFDGNRSVGLVPTVAGSPTDQALPFRLEGELPTAGSKTVVFARASAERAGLSIGDSVRLAGWCTGDGDPVELAVPVDLRVTGLSIGLLDVEPPGIDLTLEPAYVDPDVFELLIVDGVEPQQNATVWLDPKATEEEIEEALASFTIIVDFHERQVFFNDALANDANLLWLLAAVGGFAGLLVLAPLIGRNLRDTGPDSETLAALGTQRPQIAQQALAHVGALAVIGALFAAIVSVPISAFMPAGLASAIDPHRELWFDGVLIIIGIALIVTVVMVIGAIPAWRIGRAERSIAAPVAEPSSIVGFLGLRPAARTGMSAALGAPAGPRRASPWPSLISMVVAAIVGVASLTYLAGLRHLEATPKVLGWNWDAVVAFDFDQGDPDRSHEILDEIKQLDAVEEVTAGTFYPPWFLFVPNTDIFVWAWSFDTGPDAITPAMLSGRAPEGPDEIAVSAVFVEQSGLGVGDLVTLARPTLITHLAEQLTERASEFGFDLALETPEQTPVVSEFEITGIALMPSDPGQSLAEVALTLNGFADLAEPDATEVAAARAWLPDDLPNELRDGAEEILTNLDIDDRAVYVRFSGSVEDGAAAIAAIEGAPEVVAPTPAQVLTLMVGLNIDRNDRVPLALAIMVAVAFFALASYLLFFSIRSRRFEMAVMRALGLSTRGVRWSVAVQATATAIVALLIGVPIGLLVGRWAWLEYARDLKVQPVSIMPWWQLALVCVAAIVVANVVAVVPGWLAARRSPGHDLRTE